MEKKRERIQSDKENADAEIVSKYPKKKTLKESYAIGSGDYAEVYEPVNPIQDLIGGEVKFRHFSGNKAIKRRRE